jgi:phosphoglycerate dehydrogenase-like enzyme
MHMKTYKVAVLDDYQNAALDSADWAALGHRAEITVFEDHLADPEAVIERLLPFDVICVMRERSPLPRNIIERLPNLKLIASTGAGNASIDVAAAGDHGHYDHKRTGGPLTIDDLRLSPSPASAGDQRPS